MCIHVYIYIYIYGCICVGLCVLWVAVRIISSIFEAASECLEGLPLFILLQRPHIEPCPREPARPEVRGEKDERRWSGRSETPAIRKSHSLNRDAGRERSRGVRTQHGVSEDDGQ